MRQTRWPRGRQPSRELHAGERLAALAAVVASLVGCGGVKPLTATQMPPCSPHSTSPDSTSLDAPSSRAPSADARPSDASSPAAASTATPPGPASAPAADPTAARPRPPNVVLVIADDLGYGELGCYGQSRIDTPNVDRLAREGARLTNFYAAAPVCAPSRCALITGRHLGHASIRDNGEIEPEGQVPMPLRDGSLAADMRFAGYATACIGKWGLGFVGSTGDPNSAGFDLFFGVNCQRQAHNYFPTHLWRNADRIALPGNDPTSRAEAAYAPDLMLAEAVAFIERPHDRPFFLAYTSPLPHLALQPPADELARYALRFNDSPYVGGKGYLPHLTPRAAYAAMITRLDSEVGALRAAVERAGLAGNTLILVTSDNGPTHDVGGVDTAFFDSTGGLRGRKGSLWEGGIRVPCVAWWPGRIAAGRTVDDVAWTVDLRATLTSLAGFDPPASDGASLLPALVDGASVPARALTWIFPGYGGQEAVREGRWKAIRRDLAARAKAGPVGPTDGWMLFDLATDPAETTDLAAAHPDVVARLAAIAVASYTPGLEMPAPWLE